MKTKIDVQEEYARAQRKSLGHISILKQTVRELQAQIRSGSWQVETCLLQIDILMPKIKREAGRMKKFRER